MAIRADNGRRPLPRKELRAMTIQTRSVFRKICDVLKGRIAFAHILPVF
jgi:hypothetical protein